MLIFNEQLFYNEIQKLTAFSNHMENVLRELTDY